MEFSLDQLKFFVTAARAGSFSEAGRQLDRSQSSVSTAVANLEISLGVDLFDRGARSLELTGEGRILLREAETILFRCSHFQNRALAFSEDTDSRLRIAVDESLQGSFLLDRIHPFEEAFPFTELEILTGLFNDVQDLVAGGRADMGILVGTGMPDAVPGYRLIAYLPFRAAASKAHPLALKDEVTLADLEGERQIVVTGRGGERGREMTMFSGRSWVLESYHTALAVIRRGLGWGFLPEPFVEEAAPADGLVFLPLRLETRSHTSPVYLLWSKEAAFRKAGQWVFDRLSLGDAGN